MKILDVHPFQDVLRRNIAMLDRLENEMGLIQRSIEGLVAMEDSLKGDGGHAIRTFYAECHLPFLQFVQLFKDRFTTVLKQMDLALDSLEPDPSGYIREDFLEGEIEHGLQHIARLTENLTDETNSIMNQVADIVALPHLDDSEVQYGIRNAKMKRNDTVTQLHEFDATQTAALMPLEQDLLRMEAWISNMEGLFSDGLTDIHFSADRWAELSSGSTLRTDLILNTTTMNGQTSTIIEANLAGQNPMLFGYGFVEEPNSFYGLGIFTFPGMATYGRPIDTGIDEVYDGNVRTNPNPFSKSLNSFGEIGTDFVDGLNTRADKALDSPYDFANYATLGASDALISGAKSRTKKALDSPFDFANYMTIGMAGMLKGAFQPEDSFSKEHWLDSFGVATSFVGGVKAVAPKSSIDAADVKRTGNTGKVASEVDGLGRIDYLHGKYGKLTFEELNQRINLRGETLNELQNLKASGISNSKMGPAFAGVYDKTTGKYYYSINDFDGISPNFQPIIKLKYDSMPKEVFDSYKYTKGAGSHAEIIALNDALKANPHASLDDFVINVIRTGQNRKKPAGMMFPRCPHCVYLTDGFEFITEVPKNVK